AQVAGLDEDHIGAGLGEPERYARADDAASHHDRPRHACHSASPARRTVPSSQTSSPFTKTRSTWSRRSRHTTRSAALPGAISPRSGASCGYAAVTLFVTSATALG